MFLTLLSVSGVIFSQVQKNYDRQITRQQMTKMSSLKVSGSKAIIDSLHYDGAHANNVGGVGAATVGAYIFFPSSQCAAHNALGNKITKVKIYLNEATTYVTSAQIKFHSSQSTMVYSQPFTPVNGWNEVTLTTAFDIPATDLYIGYEVVITGGYPFGCDAGPVNTNGNWLYHSMLGWTHLTNVNPAFTYNWNIRAMVDGVQISTPNAGCSPLTWDAGHIAVGTSGTSDFFTLTNNGSGNLTCSGITGLSAPFTTSLVIGSVNLGPGQSTTFTFSYNPTIVGTNNQTVVIATNGGNISISLTGTAVTCSTISAFPWLESFEDAHFAPACWKKENPDGGSGWSQFATITPTGGGTKVAYCTPLTGGTSYNDQWLITPKIAVQTGQELSFYLYWNGTKQDHVDVKVSTTTNDVASFTTTILATDSSQFDVAWKLFTVPLTAYAGQDIYIAFHEHVANNTIEGDVIGLDMVTINSPLSPVAQCSPLSWDAGNVTLASSETSGNFTLSNTGAGTLTCSSINGLNAPFTTSLIPANVSLTAGGSLTFTFSYNPVIMGTDNQTVVIATNGGNVSISLSGNGVTGIGEQDINVTAIYPNPVSDILHIAVRGEKSIEIYNLIGEMVASHRNMDEVNISGLSVGTYIVKVITGSKIHTGKFSIIR